MKASPNNFARAICTLMHSPNSIQSTKAIECVFVYLRHVVPFAVSRGTKSIAVKFGHW